MTEQEIEELKFEKVKQEWDDLQAAAVSYFAACPDCKCDCLLGQGCMCGPGIRCGSCEEECRGFPQSATCPTCMGLGCGECCNTGR